MVISRAADDLGPLLQLSYVIFWSIPPRPKTSLSSAGTLSHVTRWMARCVARLVGGLHQGIDGCATASALLHATTILPFHDYDWNGLHCGRRTSLGAGSQECEFGLHLVSSRYTSDQVLVLTVYCQGATN